jgi:hypothetical protein
MKVSATGTQSLSRRQSSFATLAILIRDLHQLHYGSSEGGVSQWSLLWTGYPNQEVGLRFP